MVAKYYLFIIYKYHLFHLMRYVSIYQFIHSSYFHEDRVEARVLLVDVLPVPPPLGLHHHPALLGPQHALHQAPDNNIVTNGLELPTNQLAVCLANTCPSVMIFADKCPNFMHDYLYACLV